MIKIFHRLLIGAICLLGLVGCQAPPQEQTVGGRAESQGEAAPPSEDETAILEESFEAGDTGSLETGDQDAGRESSPDKPRDP